MDRKLQRRTFMMVFATGALAIISACTAVDTASTPRSSSSEETGVEREGEAAPPESDVDQSDDSVMDRAATDSASLHHQPTDVSGPQDAGDQSGNQQVEAIDEKTPDPVGPVRLQIDTIDVDAHIEHVGITPDGAMDVPQEWNNVGWYEPGTTPGEPGNSVIAGHYDSPTSPAVFYRLGELNPGDQITVINQDEVELVFEVTEVEIVDADDAPLGKIFGSDTDEHNLNLITCDGVWDSDAEMYESRLVVYTKLVSD